MSEQVAGKALVLSGWTSWAAIVSLIITYWSNITSMILTLVPDQFDEPVKMFLAFLFSLLVVFKGPANVEKRQDKDFS